jgi:hypothetical protein
MTSIELQPVHWRADIDSLAFEPSHHEGQCVVHRRAFRTLLGIEATPQACIDYFHAHHAVFEAAAADKIAQRDLPQDANFHLNSRDICRLVDWGQSPL